MTLDRLEQRSFRTFRPQICLLWRIVLLILVFMLPGVQIAHATMASPDNIDGQIRTRTYPSIFMAWNEDLDQGQSTLASLARHDLLILGPKQMGLERIDRGEVLNPTIVERARQRRRDLALLNPHAVVLVEIRYYDAWSDYLPIESLRWRRDKEGRRIESVGVHYFGQQFYLLDFSQPEFQDSVATQCKTYVESGAFDGCMFDWWNPSYSDVPGTEGNARLELIQKVRRAVGDRALLIGNKALIGGRANDALPSMTANYLNGIYMEGFGAKSFSDWRRAVANLTWLEEHLRPPALTALEGWYDCGPCAGDPAKIQIKGRNDLALMREVTTLSLTNSDGYVMFGDPNRLPTPDHLHNWYPFWNKTLGHPRGPKHVQGLDGAFYRDFDNGCVVFNPPDNHAVTVSFQNPRKSEATGIIASAHTIRSGDGDIFLLVRENPNPRDGRHESCS